jgi:PII-like signaling protein
MNRRGTVRRVESDLVQLSVYVAEPHVGGRRSKVHELLNRVASEGSTGGTVLAACGGFGRRHSHEPTFWHRADETPLIVLFIDRPETVDSALNELTEILPDCFATVRPIHAIRYTSTP